MTTLQERRRTLRGAIKAGAEQSGLSIPRLSQLRKDLGTAAAVMGDTEARYLVDYYYIQQEDRKRAHNQVRALLVGEEPHTIISWLANNAEQLETVIRLELGKYAERSAPGQWLMRLTGIGPVISAGLIAHVDITRCRTVSQLWRFAGLDPNQEWLGREGADALVKEVCVHRGEVTSDELRMVADRAHRNVDLLIKQATDKGGAISRVSLTAALAKRPWNASLKTLAWKAGESFVKFQNHPEDDYGHYYVQRKAMETSRNEQGAYANDAANKLARFKIGHDTEAFGWYSKGMLPPAHIHARATRWTVKIFLSHFHYMLYTSHYGTEPPMPYVFDHLGHQHLIPVPAGHTKNGRVPD